ncbi:IS1634 family transposase [Bacillota bacterium]
MFLIQEKRKNGTNLCIVQSYRDPVTKASKTKRIMNIGYLEDLQKQYDDPVAHFKNIAKEMKDEYVSDVKPVKITLDPKKLLEPEVDLIKNFGYTALSTIYHELKMDVFFNGKQRFLDIDYNLNSVMKLLVYGTILYHGSIKQIYGNKDQFFDKMDFSLNDIYRSFPYLNQCRGQIQSWVHDSICKTYGRSKSQMYYYVTKHYFETSEQDYDGKYSDPNAQRTDPIVQMGLFVDTNGLPVSYELFPRNPADALVISPEIKKRAREFGIGKVILVGDNGTNSAENLYYAASGESGYIAAQNIRSADNETKEYVLNQEGYTPFEDACRIKSRIYTRTIRVTTADGGKKNVSFKEKQIVFHSPKYAKCVMAEREDVLLKAKDLIAFPSKYSKTTARDAAKFVQNIEYDRKSGRVLQGSSPLMLNEERLIEEEKYDGYYLFITSETDRTVSDIIHAYEDLWEIEEYFKYKNSSYRPRPIFISRLEHMHAHYLTCFLSLTLMRILENKINNKYPLEQVLQSLRKCNCVNIDGSNYMKSYFDPVLDFIGQSIGLDFAKRFVTLQNIKKSIGITKKR